MCNSAVGKYSQTQGYINLTAIYDTDMRPI